LGLPQPFLPQQREDGLVCVVFHARRQQPEVPDVVTVTVGDVIRERGHEHGWRVCGLDDLAASGVLRHKSNFLTTDRSKPVLRNGRSAGVPARMSEELLFAPKPLDVNVRSTIVRTGP
jgi:hypothetical protein